jgi:hypothetical protein
MVYRYTLPVRNISLHWAQGRRQVETGGYSTRYLASVLASPPLG